MVEWESVDKYAPEWCTEMTLSLLIISCTCTYFWRGCKSDSAATVPLTLHTPYRVSTHLDRDKNINKDDDTSSARNSISVELKGAGAGREERKYSPRDS